MSETYLNASKMGVNVDQIKTVTYSSYLVVQIFLIWLVEVLFITGCVTP
jgi:hypothetical protein